MDGYIIQKYQGWTPEISNILFLNKNNYNIDFQPILWDYKDTLLTTVLFGKESKTWSKFS